jgi:hypothetical protein
MAFHFWRVRKAGGVIAPRTTTDASGGEQVLFFPHLLTREVAQALVIVAIVILLATLVGAPLGERANPGMSPNPAKAPWYFMGFQELLIHLHPVFAVLVIPLAALAAAAALPWCGHEADHTGHWFLTVAGRRAAALAAGVAIATIVGGVLVDAWLTPSARVGADWLARGLFPTSIFAGLAVTLTIAARHWLRLGRNESVQTLVVYVAVSFATLTVIGALFRGTDMALTVPWGG